MVFIFVVVVVALHGTDCANHAILRLLTFNHESNKHHSLIYQQLVSSPFFFPFVNHRVLCLYNICVAQIRCARRGWGREPND